MTPDGLEAMRTVLTTAWTQIGSVVTTITGKPVLMIPVGVAFAGAAIGLAKRLMGTGRRRRR